MTNTRVLIAMAVVFALPSLALGQRLDARVTGRVVDESGRNVPGVTVSAIEVVTGGIRTAVADDEGRYALRNLPAGTYDIRAELQGVAPSFRRAQPLRVGTSIEIDLVVVLGVAESVEVLGRASMLDAGTHAPTRIVQRDEIDALPVVDRNFNDLAALAPGVTKTGVYGGVDISGSRDFQNAYQLDGVSAELQRLGSQRMSYAQDWIQEFQVVAGQFNAEFGNASGGVVNVITRSGGNALSGRAYGFFRDDRWDARPAFTTRKPPLDENRLGGTVGGPIVRNRLFYFGGVERLSSESSNVVNSTFASANGTVPSSVTRTASLIKLDARLGEASTARFRYSGQREHTTGSGVGGISTEEHGRYSDARVNDAAGAWTWIASPRVVNEMRGAWSTSVPETGCTFALHNPLGTWFERSYPGAKFGCPVNFGTLAEDQLQIVQNLSWSRGRHDLTIGSEARWTRSFGDFRNLRDGRYSFERDVPFDIADPASYPFAFSVVQGQTAWDVWGSAGGVFIQDSWRLTEALTISAGVRYDVDGSLTGLNRIVRIDMGMHRIDADFDNVAPRAGFAWRPLRDGRTVIRGGAGLFYDQNHDNVTAAMLLNNILVERNLSINANKSLENPFWPDVAAAKQFLAIALVQNTIPDFAALPGIVGGTNDVDRNLQIPATTQISGGVAHERGPLSASMDLVYSKGHDLYVIRDVNLDPTTFQRLNANYNSILSFGNGGTNTYKALQAQVNFVPSARHLLKVAYTLAQNHSNTSATLSTGVATNPFDYSEDAGPTDNDVRHTVAVNGATFVALGVQLSGILSYRSALPYSATTNAIRPDGKPFGFRPEPRNSRRGDESLTLDMRVTKVVRLGRGRSASAFAEVFNVTNALNLGDYIGTMTSSQFGVPTTAAPRRRVQLGFRFDF